MKNKHYFLSANTSDGFCNKFYNATRERGYVYIIKGGSGTGKSTLMKKVGEYFEQEGEEVEYFHCSSDPNSLDGVSVYGRNVAIVDGTSPHVIDTNIAGADSKIINLTNNISNKIKKCRDEIERIANDKKQSYNFVYELLKISGNLYKINKKIENNCENNINIEKTIKKIIIKLNIFNQNKNGTKRNLFRKVLSDDGEVEYDNINSYSRCIKVKAGVEYSTKIFEQVCKTCVDAGYDVICFYDYLSKDDIEAIYIKQLDAIVKRDNIKITINNCKDVELFVNNEFMIEGLLSFAGKYLARAKKCHFEIEKIYKNYVDFSNHESIAENLIKEIKTNFPIL